jgi:hypothetical protein
MISQRRWEGWTRRMQEALPHPGCKLVWNPESPDIILRSIVECCDDITRIELGHGRACLQYGNKCQSDEAFRQMEHF